MTQTMSCSKQKCKALEVAYGGYRCQLGFKIDKETNAPAEECPCPKTYLALQECREDIKRY